MSTPGQRGFTLIEILVAMLIVLAGVAGIFALLATGVGMQRDGLELARAARQLDGIVSRLESEVAAGLHDDPQTGRWRDVVAARFAPDLVYGVEFPDVPGPGGLGALPVRIRMAGREQDLARARPVSCVLTPSPPLRTAVTAPSPTD